MSTTKSIEQAHREAAISLVNHAWYREILLRTGKAPDEGDTLLRVAESRVGTLTKEEAPPDDLIRTTDEFFSIARANLAEDLVKNSMIVDDPSLADAVYPGNPAGAAAGNVEVLVLKIAALDAVWSPA